MTNHWGCGMAQLLPKFWNCFSLRLTEITYDVFHYFYMSFGCFTMLDQFQTMQYQVRYGRMIMNDMSKFEEM
jgi:hypothetical protein